MKREPRLEVWRIIEGKNSIVESAVPQWYWHLRGANGKVMCQGEGHPTKAKAVRAARRCCDAMYQIVDRLDYTYFELPSIPVHDVTEKNQQ